nr:MAG TPA: hypothetical protein [Caudoviricetes sp.]
MSANLLVYFEGRPFFFGAFFGGALEDSGLALETFFAIYILALQNVIAKNPLYTHIILENINIVKIILKSSQKVLTNVHTFAILRTVR